MLYRNILLLTGLFSTALASPLELRANAPSTAPSTVQVLEELAREHKLAWVDHQGKQGKVRVLKLGKGEWAHAEAAVAAHHHRRGVTPAAPATNALELAARQVSQVETVSSMYTKCYGSGSWALDSALVPLISGICSDGALNFFEDAGSAQVLHFLGLQSESGAQMSVLVKLQNWLDWNFNPLNEQVCQAMAESLTMHDCQGKNADTRGGWVTVKNMQGQDAASLTIDPTTEKCNC